MNKLFNGININEIVNQFFYDSSITKAKPNFVIITGNIGSGKTTLRQQKYSDKYVVVDGAEILFKITDKVTNDFREFLPVIDIIGALITQRAISENRNIVMETVGEDETEMISIIDAVKKLGYIIHYDLMSLDPEECLRRHQKAVTDNGQYLSCYFTKDLHKKWILDAADKLNKNAKQQNSKPFSLSEEDFIAGNYRTIDGIKSGREPITTDVADLIQVHSAVLGEITARDNFVLNAIKKKYGKFTDSSKIPAGYVEFGDIKRNDKVFVIKSDLAAELDDVGTDISQLSDADYFTNKIFKKR